VDFTFPLPSHTVSVLPEHVASLAVHGGAPPVPVEPVVLVPAPPMPLLVLVLELELLPLLTEVAPPWPPPPVPVLELPTEVAPPWPAAPVLELPWTPEPPCPPPLEVLPRPPVASGMPPLMPKMASQAGVASSRRARAAWRALGKRIETPA
jgi:hypothetical protein